MKETAATKRTWIAGIMEHRIALGIAVLVSILLIVFMLRPSENHFKNAERDMHVMAPTTNSPALTTNQGGSEQKDGENPKYSIPKKPATHPQAPAYTAQSSVATRPLTPAPSAKPSDESRKAASVVSSNQTTAQQTTMPAQIYFVQVGSYRDIANARKQAALLLQKGWNSSIATNAAGLHTVRIGPVSTRTAAEQLRQRLIDKAKLKGFIVEG